MNIAIIRLSSMGDVILTSPLFARIMAQMPDCRITFFTSSRYCDLFKNDLDLSKVIAVDSNCDFEIPENSHWDQIVDIQDNRRSRRVVEKLNPPGKIRRIDKARLKRWLLIRARIDLFGSDNHVVNRYIEAATGSRIDLAQIPPVKIYADTPIEAVPGISDLFSNNARVVALLPFSAWKNKQWPIEYYAKVGRHLIATGKKVILLGGPEDKKASTHLKEKIGGDCIDTAGTLTLVQCAAVLRRCVGALGNDSGLSHLARGCGVPTGFIYGSTARQLGFFPLGIPTDTPQFRVFETSCFCRPCHAHGGNVCFRIFRPCLQGIEPKKVISALDAMVEL